MKLSRSTLAGILGIGVRDVRKCEGIEWHPDGRVSFRRPVDRKIWEFIVVKPQVAIKQE